MEPLTISILAGGIFAGLSAASVAALKGWQGWLELRRFELTHAAGDRMLPPAGNRIEVADLRERVRKLEAIAAGIDLYAKFPRPLALPSKRRAGPANPL